MRSSRHEITCQGLAGLGIIGANGAGKSTLFRMLVGQEQPDSGELIVGETVRTMYVDQSREALDSERSVAPSTYISWGLTLITSSAQSLTLSILA